MTLTDIKNPYVAVGILPHVRPTSTVDDIILAVSAILKIHPDNMKIRRDRTKEFVFARYMCWYLIKEFKLLGLKDTGIKFGGFDHTTCMHGINAMQDLLDTDEMVRMKYRQIKGRLKLNITI